LAATLVLSAAAPTVEAGAEANQLLRFTAPDRLEVRSVLRWTDEHANALRASFDLNGDGTVSAAEERVVRDLLREQAESAQNNTRYRLDNAPPLSDRLLDLNFEGLAGPVRSGQEVRLEPVVAGNRHSFVLHPDVNASLGADGTIQWRFEAPPGHRIVSQDPPRPYLHLIEDRILEGRTSSRELDNETTDWTVVFERTTSSLPTGPGAILALLLALALPRAARPPRQRNPNYGPRLMESG
jgi:hypothetical protein